MGVVLLQALAHHAGALGVSLVVLQAFAVHGGENAAMHGLEAVAGIGQRAPDDDRHRVGEIGAAHLLFDVHGEKVGAAVGRRAAFERELGILIVCHKVFSGPPERRQKGCGKGGAGVRGLCFYFTRSGRVLARLR